MKSNFRIFLYLVFLLIAAGCKLDAPILPKLTDTAGSTTGGNNGKPDNSGDTYMPVTKGTNWTYKYNLNGILDTIKVLVDGKSITIGGKKYYESISTYLKAGLVDTTYIANENHEYIDVSYSAGISLNMYYLNDTSAAGESWALPINDSGQINGVPAQFATSIVEKGISKIVEGKTYHNVIHSKVLLQYYYGSGFDTITAYDYYSAPNIGLIEVDANGLGLSGVETLISYSIK